MKTLKPKSNKTSKSVIIPIKNPSIIISIPSTGKVRRKIKLIHLFMSIIWIINSKEVFKQAWAGDYQIIRESIQDQQSIHKTDLPVFHLTDSIKNLCSHFTIVNSKNSATTMMRDISRTDNFYSEKKYNKKHYKFLIKLYNHRQRSLKHAKANHLLNFRKLISSNSKLKNNVKEMKNCMGNIKESKINTIRFQIWNKLWKYLHKNHTVLHNFLLQAHCPKESSTWFISKMKTKICWINFQ